MHKQEALEALRRFRAAGHLKPDDVPQELWDQAVPLSAEEATDNLHRALEARVVTQAQQPLPADEKGLLHAFYPLAVLTRAKIMSDPVAKDENKLKASETFIEHTVGKPQQTVEHHGSLALEIIRGLAAYERDARSSPNHEGANLIPKNAPPVDAFIKATAPEKFIVGRKAKADVTKSEPESREGILTGTVKEAE